MLQGVMKERAEKEGKPSNEETCFDIVEDLINAHIRSKFPMEMEQQSMKGNVAGTTEKPNPIFFAFRKDNVIPYGTVHCEAALASFSKHYRSSCSDSDSAELLKYPRT
jgi:hypothetical protein